MSLTIFDYLKVALTFFIDRKRFLLRYHGCFSKYIMILPITTDVKTDIDMDKIYHWYQDDYTSSRKFAKFRYSTRVNSARILTETVPCVLIFFKKEEDYLFYSLKYPLNRDMELTIYDEYFTTIRRKLPDNLRYLDNLNMYLHANRKPDLNNIEYIDDFEFMPSFNFRNISSDTFFEWVMDIGAKDNIVIKNMESPNMFYTLSDNSAHRLDKSKREKIIKKFKLATIHGRDIEI